MGFVGSAGEGNKGVAPMPGRCFTVRPSVSRWRNPPSQTPPILDGRLEVRIELIDLLGDELRVEPIPDVDHRETNGGEHGCVHLNDTS